jgi:hypothetical protein
LKTIFFAIRFSGNYLEYVFPQANYALEIMCIYFKYEDIFPQASYVLEDNVRKAFSGVN